MVIIIIIIVLVAPLSSMEVHGISGAPPRSGDARLRPPTEAAPRLKRGGGRAGNTAPCNT